MFWWSLEDYLKRKDVSSAQVKSKVVLYVGLLNHLDFPECREWTEEILQVARLDSKASQKRKDLKLQGKSRDILLP